MFGSGLPLLVVVFELVDMPRFVLLVPVGESDDDETDDDGRKQTAAGSVDKKRREKARPLNCIPAKMVRSAERLVLSAAY